MRHLRKRVGRPNETATWHQRRSRTARPAESERWLYKYIKSNKVPAPGLEPGLTQLQRLVRCQLRYAGSPPRCVMEHCAERSPTIPAATPVAESPTARPATARRPASGPRRGTRPCSTPPTLRSCAPGGPGSNRNDGPSIRLEPVQRAIVPVRRRPVPAARVAYGSYGDGGTGAVAARMPSSAAEFEDRPAGPRRPVARQSRSGAGRPGGGRAERQTAGRGQEAEDRPDRGGEFGL
jgi:hypothetical protein